jgi:hypothetical protein
VTSLFVSAASEDIEKLANRQARSIAKLPGLRQSALERTTEAFKAQKNDLRGERTMKTFISKQTVVAVDGDTLTAIATDSGFAVSEFDSRVQRSH